VNADGENHRPIWLDAQDPRVVKIIDQRLLPHRFQVVDLTTVDHVITAICEMYVRGAPLVGVTGAYGVYLAALAQEGEGDDFLGDACRRLRSARPTAVNLTWAVDAMWQVGLAGDGGLARVERLKVKAQEIAEKEADNCRRIGLHGLGLLERASGAKGGRTVHILTHCNAGWLACVEYGTATAPIYAAFDRGIDVHVWVDETRPLNQGARLTAWELGRRGVPHTVVTDNAGGHLMQRGMVDMVLVGTDRTTCTGDVANKIGTYLKALAARDNGVPFYVALPSSTIDWDMTDGVREVPIEERDPHEVRFVQGLHEGSIVEVLVPPASSPAANFAFDVTPARLVTALITERGVCAANPEAIRSLFPESHP